MAQSVHAGTRRTLARSRRMYEEIAKLRALARQCRCLVNSSGVRSVTAAQSLAIMYDRQADEIAHQLSDRSQPHAGFVEVQ